MASLPYPRHPSRGFSGLRCTNRALVHQHCNPPTESTEHTETSGGEEPPTDFTDAHRWLGCVWFSHGIHRSFWRRRASHRFDRCTQMGPWRRVLPRNSRNSQKFCCVGPPTDFTDLHRWLGCVCSSTEFTEFTEVWGCCWLRGYGRMPYPPNLCASVRICGRLFSARNFCAFRGFCGNIVSHGLHRFAQMAWLRLFFHGIHRSFGVLLAAWVRQDAIPS